MNYLGQSIVDEVGGGTNSKTIPNAFTEDNVALQTVLYNLNPSSSLNPYRYSDGQAKNFLLSDNITNTISGPGIINYKGTYAFKMIGSWYGAIQPIATAPVIYPPEPPYQNIVNNSFQFNLVIGNSQIGTVSFIFRNDVLTITRTNPMFIEITGTMDVLNPPGNNTVIQTTINYQVYHSSFQNSGLTSASNTVNILPDENDFKIQLKITEISTTVPTSVNLVYFTRCVGTLETLHSD